MEKKKKIAIAIGVVLVLVIIGSLSPQSNNQDTNNVATPQTTAEGSANDSSATDNTEKEKSPQVKVDAMMDEIKVTSYSADDTGVTVDLSYNGNKQNLIYCKATRFEYGGNSYYLNYDPEKDAYSAGGVTFEENGEFNKFGSFELTGGSKTSLKFSVDGFTEVKDYDGFIAYFDLKYSGTFTGEIKDDYIKVRVS